MGRTADDPVRMLQLACRPLPAPLSAREVIAAAQVNGRGSVRSGPVAGESWAGAPRADAMAHAAGGAAPSGARRPEGDAGAGVGFEPRAPALRRPAWAREPRRPVHPASWSPARRSAAALRLRQAPADLPDGARWAPRVAHRRASVAWADARQPRSGPTAGVSGPRTPPRGGGVGAGPSPPGGPAGPRHGRPGPVCQSSRTPGVASLGPSALGSGAIAVWPRPAHGSRRFPAGRATALRRALPSRGWPQQSAPRARLWRRCRGRGGVGTGRSGGPCERPRAWGGRSASRRRRRPSRRPGSAPRRVSWRPSGAWCRVRGAPRRPPRSAVPTPPAGRVSGPAARVPGVPGPPGAWRRGRSSRGSG